MAVLRHEGTSAAIAWPHGALNRAWDVARRRHTSPSDSIRPGADRRWRGRLCRRHFHRRAVLPVLDLLQEQRQGTADDASRITIGDLATEKILQPAKGL